MFIVFFINVCVNDTVQLLYISIILLVMSFDWSCDSHLCCDWWLSVYYNGTKQISTLQKFGKLTLYQIMKYGLLL